MSKRLIPYLLISVPIAVAADYISLLFNENLMGLAIFFFIPIGGLLLGGDIGLLAKKAMFKDNAGCSRKVAVAIALFACLVTLGLLYFEYATCFVDVENEINHMFMGEHISSYQIHGEPLDFPGYLKAFYLNTTMAIIPDIPFIKPIDTGITGYGAGLLVLQFIVAAGVSAFFALSVNDEPKCPVCNKYYKEAKLDTFADAERADVFIQNLFSERLPEGRYQPVYETEKTGCIVKMVAKYCPDCGKGEIWTVKVNTKKDDEEVLHKRELNRDQMVYLGLLQR